MVEYVDIFGTKYPVRIGYYVMKQVKEKTGKSFSQALRETKESEDLEIHEIILWAALQMGAYAEKEELDLKEEDMPMILDACFTEYLKLYGSETFFPKELREMAQEAPKLAEKTPSNNQRKRTRTKKKKKQT